MHTLALRPIRAAAAALALLTLFAPVRPARAHGTDHGHTADGSNPQLHVGTDFEECYFDLHSELTQSEFRQFAREGGLLIRFQQMAPARTLGAGRLQVALGLTASPINDSDGAWNNTFTHPDAEHWLGAVRQFPRLIVRYGLTDAVDLGLWGSVNPEANYGFAGLDAKVALLRQSAGAPVTVSVRPSVTTLLGPSEVWLGNLSTDATVSRNFWGFEPYAGFGGSFSYAVERSADVDLPNVATIDPVAVVGLTYSWRFLTAGAEATLGAVNTYGVLVGARL